MTRSAASLAVAVLVTLLIVAAPAGASVLSHDIRIVVARDATAFTVHETVEPSESRAFRMHVPMPATGLAVADAESGGAVAWTLEEREILRVHPAEPNATVSVRYAVDAGAAGSFSKRFLESSPVATVTLVVPDGTARRANLGVGDTAGTRTGTEDGTAWRVGPAPVEAGAVIEASLAPATSGGLYPVGAVVVALFLMASVGVVLLGARGAVAADMTVLDHARELRRRSLFILVALAGGTFLFLTFGVGVAEVADARVPYPRPGMEASLSADAFHLFATHFVPAGVRLIVTGPFDGVFAQFQVALLLALIVALPVAAYHIAAFLAPALTPPERRGAFRAIAPGVALFVLGVAFSWAVMVPLMLRVLYGYATGLGVTPFLAAGELVSVVVFMSIVFGVAFELPVGMVAAVRMGLVSARSLRGTWRHTVVGIFIVAAVLTPDPTVVSQLLLALPLLALYGVGLTAAVLSERSARRPARPR